jgi:hypothetical protein
MVAAWSGLRNMLLAAGAMSAVVVVGVVLLLSDFKKFSRLGSSLLAGERKLPSSGLLMFAGELCMFENALSADSLLTHSASVCGCALMQKSLRSRRREGEGKRKRKEMERGGTRETGRWG